MREQDFLVKYFFDANVKKKGFIEEKIKDVKEIIGSNKLYKYYKINNDTIDALSNRYIYLNKLKNFNDPFDCKIGYNKTQIINKQIISLLYNKEELKLQGVIKNNENDKKIAKYYPRLSKLGNEELYNLLVDINVDRICKEHQLYDIFKNHDKNEIILTYVTKNDSLIDFFCNKDKQFMYLKIFSSMLSNEEKITIYCTEILNMKEKQAKMKASEILRGFDDEYKKMSDLIDKENSKFGIFCLTPSNNNLLMWSHYADSHKGICVEFDLNNQDNSFFDSLFPVIYTNRCCIDSSDLNVKAKPNLKKLVEKEYNAIFVKAEDWSYEKEWRIVCQEQEEQDDSFRKMPIRGISAVYFGMKISDDDKNRVMRMFH